jgi:hypothetical protein
MTANLEDRLERLAEAFPTPTAEARRQACAAALAVLGSPRRRHRRWTGLLLAAGAVAASAGAVVAMVIAPWRDGPLATERALAALGDQPVVHAIVEGSGAETKMLVDLASGETVREFYRTEYWYDEERETLRARVTIGDQRLLEVLDSPQGFFTDRGAFPGDRPSAPRLDPALAGFVTGYREALENDEARVVGEEVVDGRNAVVLRIRQRVRPAGEEHWEDIAVDGHSYRPLRFRFGGTDREQVPWDRANRVVAIETTSRDPRDFVRPEPEPQPAERIAADRRTADRAEAAAALGGRAVWPGPTVAGLDLRQIEVTRITSRRSDGRETQTHLLDLQYGGAPSAGPRGRWLLITEGTSAEETPRVGAHEPAPAPGKLRLTGREDVEDDADIWFGSMQVDGVYVVLQSPHRDLLLAAARAMQPLR